MGFKPWWKATAWSLVSGEKDAIKGEKGLHYGITQFQSVCTALAATVGTGNIAGVAAALVSGDPGAVFWMWVSALIGWRLLMERRICAVSTALRMSRENGSVAPLFI